VNGHIPGSGFDIPLSLTTSITRELGIAPGDLEVLAWREDRVVCRARIGDRDVVVKASGTEDAFAEEARAMRRMKAIGLPVSDVVSVVGGSPAMLISTWAEGYPISATSDPDTLRQVGAILRRVHEQPAGPPFSGNESIEAWIEGWFGAVTRWWFATDRRSRALAPRCHQWLAEVKPVLATRTGAMALFDGRPEHFLVDTDGTIRLIDVADLQPGDPAMDLAVLELDAPGILVHVLDGYGPDPAQAASFNILVPFYTWLRALSGAEWQQRMIGNNDEARRYLEIAERLLESGNS
jgi:aminoglycoside phosphotransferase (APT) family kinase protein